MKEDLKKVFNVGKAIFNWSKTGLGRLWEGLPKVFGVPNPAWLFNPLNMVDKVKLLGKAFFSRDPMVEEKDKEKNKKKSEMKKISKEFKMGGKKYDLSKLQGGLSNEDYLALTNKDRGILDRRLQAYANQNAKERHAAIKGNAENILPLDVNSVAKKTNNISTYDEEEETVVIKPGSETGGDVVPETETKESITPVVVGGGGGSREIDEALYKSG